MKHILTKEEEEVLKPVWAYASMVKVGYTIAIDRLLRLAESTRDDTEQHILFLAAEELASRFNINISEELEGYDTN